MEYDKYDKILLNQIKKAGFDITQLPKNLKLHFHKKKFAGVPDWVIELSNKKTITRTALCIYANISLLCYNNKSFTWLSKSELARKSGVKESTVYKAINDLIDAGAIAVFTQKIGNSREKSLMIILPERNIRNSKGYIKSIRGGRHKTSDKNNMMTATPGCNDGYTRSHTAATPDYIVTATPDHIGSIRTTESEEGKYKKGIRVPNFSPTEKNFGHFVNAKGQSTLEMANQLIENYYTWANNSFRLDLEPRSGDYKNAFELVDRKGATPEIFLKFIQENIDNKFFLKSDKHFSVWTSDISISKYSEEYRDIFLDEAD